MILKRTFFSVVVISICFFKTFGQVNLQTGSAVFSLPMFNWQDDKSRLVSVVAITYNSGNGLKVNDLASNVGQGWNLVAGGSITRMQIGQPDDQPAFSGAYPQNGDGDITKYPAGYLYDTIPVERGCPRALSRYPVYGGQGVVYSQHNSMAQDREQDYFAFQFNGKSGMFVVDTAGGWHGDMLGDSKMKVSLQLDPTMTSQGIRTTITAFTITDVDGLIYKFSLHGVAKVLTNNPSNSDGSRTTSQPKIVDGGKNCQAAFDFGPTGTIGSNGQPQWVNKSMAYPYIINSWYLSEIDDPFTSRKITFGYITRFLNNSAGADITYVSSGDNHAYIDYKRSIDSVRDISSISFPDGHLVNFNYSNSQRADYLGEYALSTVSVSYNGRYLSQYQLGTSYFIKNRCGTPTKQNQSLARLCLLSVKKIGVDFKEDSPPYQFQYYTSTGSNNIDDYVPPPFYYIKDIWGFYNGNYSISALSSLPGTGTTMPVNPDAPIPFLLDINELKGLCFLNNHLTGTYYNAKPGYAANGLLKQIIYPTGGSLTYSYAQNTGSFVGSPSTVRTVGGVHVSQTSSSDAGYSNGCGNPIVTNYNYVMNGPGSASSLWGLETPNNFTSNTTQWQEWDRTIHFSFSSPFGECKWHYIYPGVMTQYQSVSIDNFQHIMAIVSPVLGVLSVVGTISDVINLVGASSVVLYWVAVILDVITAVLTYVLSCPRKSKPSSSSMYYNFDMNSVAPLPAQYKRVEITESSGSIGKTIQQFTHGDPDDPNGNDYPLWFGAGTNKTLSAKQRFAPWAYGLPKITTVYDVNGNKIKETQNVYNFTYAREPLSYPVILPSLQRVNHGITNCKCQVNNNVSDPSNDWSDPKNYNNYYSYYTPYSIPASPDMAIDFYYMNSGRVQLDSSYERVYRVGSPLNFVQTATRYQYNSDGNSGSGNYFNYEPFRITTQQSNGDLNFKNIYYSSDYNKGVLATMVNANMVSVPVSTNTSVQKAGSSTIQYLSEKATEFAQLPNGDIKASRVIEQRFASPVTSFTAYSGPTTTNYANYKIPQVFTYDLNGNLTGLQDEGNRAVANIYDYNDKYIVASLINANNIVDKPAYTSFESGDFSRSGWNLSGTGAAYSTTNFITGSQGFVLNGNTLTAGLNNTEPYLLSFWANNSSVVVTGGASISKTGPTYFGMTYYEYNIPAGASTVSVSGSSTIDELRLYPSAARMRTTTYDPLIGKTSECDENNRITYYSYDNLGRLRFIKDEAGNIIKMYEYNNISATQQVGCPATYFNSLITETFTRSNCTSGYQGGLVSYSVPANKYSSTISQTDADAKAEIDLLTNGPALANSTGSCSLIYYNTVKSVTDTTQTCAIGYSGGLVTYTVPASVYSSIISQADADQQALDEIAASAQSFANDPQNAVCNINTAPDWEWNPGDTNSIAGSLAGASYCSSVNGVQHQFVSATDVNPNSPTYNQTQYFDYGPSASCPATNNCTSGCYVLPMQTYGGRATLGYPVGVFNVSGKLLGNAATASQYIALWNSDPTDNALGSLMVGGDSLHFNLALAAGKTAPTAVTGMRYYQIDIAYTQIDAVRAENGEYIDFGDGTGFNSAARPTTGLPPNTTANFFGPNGQPYYIHTYPTNAVKTITFYHSDSTEHPGFDNYYNPATSLTLIQNIRGNFPQQMTFLWNSSLQQASANSVAGISNWSSINSVTNFGAFAGDAITSPCMNMSFAQDFMANNKGLQVIWTTYGPTAMGIVDPTFKLTRLKSDWNTYFTGLNQLTISDSHWNREDLSALINLKAFGLDGTTANGLDATSTNPVVPLPSFVIDNALNQIAAGAGQYVYNGGINIRSGGSFGTSASSAAIALLKSKGWSVTVNGQTY